jgi:predicted molibdopterin-dependent oxidoreductase YjgC
VNSYFMCDHGRLNYRWMNRQDRVDVPMVRHGATLAGTDWQLAITEAARLLSGKKAFVLASPMLSNEALFLLSSFSRRVVARDPSASSRATKRRFPASKISHCERSRRQRPRRGAARLHA